MAAIVLCTFNARYQHAAFGLRYLKANLGDLESQCDIVEFDLDKRPADALESVLARNPSIVGLGVYVWNTRPALEFARLLKAVRPDLTLVLGGPEISFEHREQEISRYADHIITGEADVEFASLCRTLMAGNDAPRVVSALPADLAAVAAPYRLYTDEDIAHRTLYVESSRGCPFGCEFCLSSLDLAVRRFELEGFLQQMQQLLDRGARRFKFVDRTFNVNTPHAAGVLEFFLARIELGLFLHFEMVPDQMPDGLRELLPRFPAGSLQLELGVQTFNEDVARRIGRRQDNRKVEENLRYLRQNTHAHLHADLVAGLPGESLESFAAGFDRLLALAPHEIQLGILKRLRGAPIARHTGTYAMVYAPDAPYEILQNNQISFEAMQRLKRIARLWDLFSNSGNFRETLPILLGNGSAFGAFGNFCDFVFARTGKTHELSLTRQCKLLMEYLGEDSAGPALAADYVRPGRRDVPGFLQPFAPKGARPAAATHDILQRQRRHMD